VSYIAYYNPDKYLSERNALNITHHTTSSGHLGLSLQERCPRTYDLRPQHHLPICSNVRPVPFRLVALRPSPLVHAQTRRGFSIKAHAPKKRKLKKAMVRTETKSNVGDGVEAITYATVHHYRRRPSALQEVALQFCPRGLVLAAVLLDDHGEFLHRVIVLISSSCMICHGIHLLASLLVSSSCFPPPFVTPWRTSITVILRHPVNILHEANVLSLRSGSIVDRTRLRLQSASLGCL
jgi:hypothetical protein